MTTERLTLLFLFLILSIGITFYISFTQLLNAAGFFMYELLYLQVLKDRLLFLK